MLVYQPNAEMQLEISIPNRMLAHLPMGTITMLRAYMQRS